MKLRLTTSSVFFLGLIGLMVAVSMTSFVGALSWINRPFAGFLLYKDAFVSVSGDRDWPGPKAGLKFLDRIEAVDGVPVKEGPNVVDLVKEKAPNTPVRYRIESEGKFFETTIPVAQFGLKDLFLVFVIPFLVGFMVYALGCIVYVLKPGTSTSNVFLVLCFCLGTMILAGFENQSTYILTRFFYAINIIYPATFVHLFLIFPDRKRFLIRFPALEYLLYLPAALLIIAFEIYLSFFPEIFAGGPFAWFPTYRELGSVHRVYVLVCVVGMVFLIFHGMYRASFVQARQRAKVIFWGVTLAFVPPAIFMALMFYLKVNFPWNFLAAFVIFFPAAIAYSIVRHNLFDADTVIKLTVGYVIVTAVVVGVYAVVSVGFNVFLGKYELAQSRAFPILFTMAIIFLFNPLRDRIQGLVDRLFFRKEYDYGEIVDKISEAITSLMDLGQVLNRLTRTFIEDMFINTTSVMLLNPTAAEYRVYVVEGERRGAVEGSRFGRDDPLIRIMEEQKKELTKYDVLEDPKYKTVSEQCAANFDKLQATLMVPLVFKSKVIGLMNLGEKKSGKPFNREDINLLHSVANQGAVAIENARLFKENLDKQRMEEELAIARDLQLSMLPAASPEMKGFQIAALSTPAREVGGDFFDFIEMGDGGLGFVIGDVTGKSVSGALVMSASRSVFRMLSEERLDVGEIMVRANRRMKKDIKSGMFVALLYAVMDSKTRVLNLCSAGQTQPIHYSTETGKASLVQTEGDTFPIGILDEADYKETRLQLAPGDRLVFYTDGIVEATNEQGEMFGFERLLGLVQETRSTDADELLKEILEKVSAFVGAAPQHDDLTAITVSVSE
jgi:sigma-B regulation protein RsbU (phosphoserine phosphatase)